MTPYLIWSADTRGVLFCLCLSKFLHTGLLLNTFDLMQYGPGIPSDSIRNLLLLRLSRKSFTDTPNECVNPFRDNCCLQGCEYPSESCCLPSLAGRTVITGTTRLFGLVVRYLRRILHVSPSPGNCCGYSQKHVAGTLEKLMWLVEMLLKVVRLACKLFKRVFKVY